jgi:hypothetical protein
LITKKNLLIQSDHQLMATAETILESVKSGTLSISEAQEQLAKLKLADRKKVTYKVSVKGAISFYGIRKMPITLYLDELRQIMELANADEFEQFVSLNADKLSSKEKNREKD